MSNRRTLFVLVLAACSSNSNPQGGVDAPGGSHPDGANPSGDGSTGSDSGGPFTEATHPAQPTLMSGGAAVLATPKIVPVFFAGDSAQQATIEDFLTQLSTSTFWPAIASEYGVGTLTIASSVVATETPPTTDSDLQTLISSHSTGTGGWPAADASTVYAVFLPTGVTLTSLSGTSCANFGGYHSSVSNITYALIPRCAASGDFTVLQNLTTTISHELLEAATDPTPLNGYATIDNDDVVYRLEPGAEIADMCELQLASYQNLVGSYMVQRTWSNASAAAGHDPCVPVLATPYVEAAANLSDVSISVFGFPVTTRGVQVANGTSQTIEVDLYSDAPTADWSVEAVDVASTYQGVSSPQLSFSWDHTTGNNGDKLQLTIKRLATGAFGFSEFQLKSSVNGVTIGTWWGAVSQ